MMYLFLVLLGMAAVGFVLTLSASLADRGVNR
jgi:hypothetical protein